MLRQTNQQPITTLYPRPSHEGELQGESDSISNRKHILETYAKQNGLSNLRWYTDGGYSGANFQRPGFQTMLVDIEVRKVGIVIVKDMSRLRRNYLRVEMYTEMIFPQKGVRFITISDGVNNAQGDNDLAPLRDVFNEWLVRDTSKKIKAVKRSKGTNGKPITSKPVYDYLMDGDKSFIIDEEATPVIKQIYGLCLVGNGPTKIARMLTERQIPTPGTLEYRRTGNTRRYHPDYECKWATNTVVHILENRGYTGCLVNFKAEELSYKVKHSVKNLPEKQVIFGNHHEPITNARTWERVQELRERHRRPDRYDEVSLFSDILLCTNCDSVVYQQRYQADKCKQDCYICGNYEKRTHNCTTHSTHTGFLTVGILSNLRKVTSYAAKYEARFIKLLIEQNEDGGKRRNAAKRKELETSEKRITELSAIFRRLYEDSVTGYISDERPIELSADCKAEQRELKERAAATQAELPKTQEVTVNAEKFVNVVRRHTNFEELTPALLRELIEKIVVHECSYDENKTRRQDIEIYYSFVDEVNLPEQPSDLSDTMRKCRTGATKFFTLLLLLYRTSIKKAGNNMPRIRFQTLTKPMYYMLLIFQEPHYRYEIMQEIAALTQNHIQIGADTLYTPLAHFEDEGMMWQTAVADRKKIYYLTSHDHHILMTKYKRLVSMMEGDHSRLKLIWDGEYLKWWEVLR